MVFTIIMIICLLLVFTSITLTIKYDDSYGKYINMSLVLFLVVLIGGTVIIGVQSNKNKDVLKSMTELSLSKQELKGYKKSNINTYKIDKVLDIEGEKYIQLSHDKKTYYIEVDNTSVELMSEVIQGKVKKLNGIIENNKLKLTDTSYKEYWLF